MLLSGLVSFVRLHWFSGCPRSFTVYHNGAGRGSKAGVSCIGVILIAESFYVKQVLQNGVGGSIKMDQKGGATVPWHHFDAGIPAA